MNPGKVAGRKALYEWVLKETDGEDISSAVTLLFHQLHPVNHEQTRHFLVPLLWDSKTPKPRIDGCTRLINSYIRNRPKLGYLSLLSRAIIKLPGARPPLELFDDYEFFHVFCKELRFYLTSHPNGAAKVREDNVDLLCMEYPIIQEALQDSIIYNAYAGQDKDNVKIDTVINQINHSLPGFDVVSRLLDDDVAEAFKADLETIENRDDEYSQMIDIDAAIKIGKKRSWASSTAQQRVDLISLFANHPDLSDFTDAYDRFCRQRQEERRERTEPLRAEIANIKFWRIRNNDERLWRKALTDNEWDRYRRAAQQMRQTYPRGLYTFINRRKYNEHSLLHMREHNLPLLEKELLGIEPPKAPIRKKRRNPNRLAIPNFFSLKKTTLAYPANAC